MFSLIVKVSTSHHDIAYWSTYCSWIVEPLFWNYPSWYTSYLQLAIRINCFYLFWIYNHSSSWLRVMQYIHCGRNLGPVLTPYIFLAIWNVVFNLGWVTPFAHESLESIEPNKISFRICGSVQDVITVLCHLESIDSSCLFPLCVF